MLVVDLKTRIRLVYHILVLGVRDVRLDFHRIGQKGKVGWGQQLMEKCGFSGVALSRGDQVMMAIDDVCCCKGIFSIHVFGNYNHIELRSNPLGVVF